MHASSQPVPTFPARTASSTRICGPAVHSFTPSGRVTDIAAPQAGAVDFAEVASRLARIARFTGAGQDMGRGMAFSVAQHSVMGAQALMADGENRHTATLFLLHDAHEYVTGDITSPVSALLAETMESMAKGGGMLYQAALARIKAGWDAAIYAAAGLPAPDAWPPRIARIVKQMDARMLAAEAEALFGTAARRTMPASKFPVPRTRGAIEPWGAMKAEEEFAGMLQRLTLPARCAA